jgi:TPR repeat protein
MLQQGDIRSARLYFEQAAEAGSGQGAIGAAKTYDPVFLATTDAPGLQGDVARAIKWYRMASATFGDQYAAERLKALAAQTDR